MTYYTAQICLNGHIITDTYNSSGEEKAENYCRQCGAKTITSCPDCNTPIRGRWVTSWVSTGEVRPIHNPPDFCHNCGKPYPWMMKKQEAAQALISELDELSNSEKQELTKYIPDIVSDTPNTELGVTKFKRAIKKGSKSVGEILYKLIIDIGSETAVKLIKGG